MMFRSFVHCTAVIATTILVMSPGARAVQIDPADARGIRLYGAELALLGFLKIHDGFTIEDRTVIEFDVSQLASEIPLATLDLGIQNQDPGGPAGIIDVFTYVGDGEIVPEEFYAGTWFTSFVFNDEQGLISVDVTPAVQGHINNGDPFIGFRLSTETADRYALGSLVHLPEPVLTIIPEPGTLLMCILSVSLLARRRRKES